MSYLTIEKFEGGRLRYGGGTWWHVVHVPTGCLLGKYRLKRTAASVVREVERAFGEILSVAAPAILTARMREIDLDLCRWIVLADEWPSLVAYRAAQTDDRRAAELLEEVRARWTGQMIHFVEGGRYGRQATITSVEAIDRDGALRCVLAWNEHHSTLGTTVQPTVVGIGLGPAPADMPWHRFSSTWRGRVGGGVYVIGWIALSPDERRYGLWTEDVPEGRDRLSEALCDFGYRSLETAQAAAAAHAEGRIP